MKRRIVFYERPNEDTDGCSDIMRVKRSGEKCEFEHTDTVMRRVRDADSGRIVELLNHWHDSVTGPFGR
jgi:hypothetical protein